ncbi:MAG: hypothetical protein U9Q92_02140 [archaeon]|nr:hypothetical protein [archaeon]
MDSELRKKIINKWTDDLALNEKIIKLAEKAIDIPYGDIGSRNPKDVYENNKGTCSGKHELLKELYQELGIRTKSFIAMHRFKDLNIDFPDKIKDVLNRSDIIDFHNFFKILVDNKWITIDITWDRPLKEWGFPVNENWDGISDMMLGIVPIMIFEVEDPIKIKRQKIQELPKQVQKDRKVFLKKLTEWFNELRQKQ